MTGLHPRDVESFEENGYLSPLDVYPEAEALDLRRQLEAAEQAYGGDPALAAALKSGAPHVLKFAAAVVRNPRITGRIAALLGPDLLLWNWSLFIKEPHTPSFVSWHQDVHYWGLADATEITAWLALSPATVESGCMLFLPGSHKRAVAHADTAEPANMLSRGQEVAVEVDEGKAVAAELKPGQMSLHHGLTFHASHPNRTDDRRIGVALRYIPTHNRQAGPERLLAILARGEDRYNHFDLAPPPAHDMEPAAVERFNRHQAALRPVLFRGAKL